jgi:hypothetical protein
MLVAKDTGRLVTISPTSSSYELSGRWTERLMGFALTRMMPLSNLLQTIYKQIQSLEGHSHEDLAIIDFGEFPAS